MRDPVGSREEDESACRDAETDPSCFHVVAIGASAGGLESLQEFFSEMPAESGMAFVVLQHLSPDFRSLMDELLARETKMKIVKAADDMQVEANTIYLNPPRKNMIISGGNLYLSDVDEEEALNLPIDQFFRSLAQDYRRQAIAIVMSGTGSDGSRGIRDVYEAGGLVMAETEETAKFDGMPRSAQETGCVHMVLAPGAMPKALTSYVNQALNPQDFADETFVPPRLRGMEEVFRLIRDQYGIDFSLYKPNTVVRRVERRIALLHSANVDAYVKKLHSDPQELNALYRDLLIGVTRFFRDREAFEYLKKTVIPDLIDQKSDGHELRVWVAGCATGEEAYSIAILIDEVLREKQKHLEVKLFATDVHPISLDFAATGIYPEDSFAEVDDHRKAFYFNETGEGYQVLPRLRQMIVFAQHNVFKDAPFTKLDLITCRNLLIYLQPLAQKKALSLFHFGLRAQGILMLGPSESPGELKDEFEACNNRWKVYRKRRDVRLPAEIRVPLGTPLETAPRITPATAVQKVTTTQRDLMLAYDQLLDRFIPSAFLLDDQRNVLHIFGSGKDYLERRAGRLSTDLLDMVRSELKPVLAAALQRVRHSAKSSVMTAVRLDNDGESQHVEIEVAKMTDEPTHHTWFMVRLEPKSASTNAAAPITTISAEEFSKDRMDDLEVELRYTKESLQTTVEELETSNEELQATNEELVASNEELQSTNEELHSVNEELYTVNAEYQNKINELTQLSNDIDNLLESTEIGTIFLDKNLIIRKFTGRIANWFDLVPRDIGRRVSAFSHNLKHPGLNEDLEQVLKLGRPVEREIQDRTGSWLHLRLHPYRSDDETDGVVMTLIDISNLKQTRAKLQRLSAIVESSDDAIIGKSFDGRIESWNRGAEKLFGYTAEEAVGQDISLILPAEQSDEVYRYIDQIRRGESVEPIETQRRTKDGTSVDIALRFSPIRDMNDDVVGISAICRDISRRKDAEREIKKLALIVQHTDNAVVLTDAAGRTEWVNEGFTKVSGYRLEEIKGKKPGHILQGPGTCEETVRLMRNRIAAQEGFNVELVNYAKSGRAYWLAIDCRPMFDEANTLIGFMAVQRDITFIKEAQKRAEDEVERRDQFLAMLSHELRNPLGALKNGLEILLNHHDLDAESRQDIEQTLTSQVSQMSRLLDDLLDVSRMTQGKILVEKKPIDLRDTARDAVAALSSLAERRDCPIKLLLADQPICVAGDAARLQQVQVNLLTNAIRHSHRGDPVTLEISKRGNDALITVTDIGEGISPELQSKVFELFYQTSSELARSEGGLGVGLSLVHDLVEKHGGHVRLFSDGVDQGATFEVTLPLEESPEEPPTSTSADDIPSMRIVIVEDQDGNRKILRKMLELHGHEVWDASNGQAGVSLIREKTPDLALVDIGLPDLSGYEVAQTLRESDSPLSTTLAALTGYGQQSDIEKALKAGFDVHLVKPLEMTKLAALLSELSSQKIKKTDG